MSADCESLIASSPTPEALAALPSLPVLAPAALSFVQAVSAALLQHAAIHAHPDLVALAFWLRKSNVDRLGRRLAARIGDGLVQPRGTVFHIAPSNVDTIFVYSWILSLLMGNANIVRVPSKRTPQAELLLSCITRLLQDDAHAEVARRTLLLRYPADDAVTARLSAVCDVRVIWGGDATVRSIRSIPIPAHASEVTFANKYSLAAIHIAGWQHADEAGRNAWARGFYNDAFGFDQMACSSPRLVLWVGERTGLEAAAEDFWSRVESLVAREDRFPSDVDCVNKLVAQDLLAVHADARHAITRDNRVSRTWLETPALHVDLHCGAGLFLESHLDALTDLAPLLSRTVQTLGTAGFDKETLTRLLRAPGLRGIDRVVPFGQALAFGEVWDGHDLLRLFVREIAMA